MTEEPLESLEAKLLEAQKGADVRNSEHVRELANLTEQVEAKRRRVSTVA